MNLLAGLALYLLKKTLAIFSPDQHAYSETFIQAHKNLRFNVKYYYGGFLPTKLEGDENLFQFSLSEKIKIRGNRNLCLSEHALLISLKRERVDCLLAEYGPTASAALKVAKYLKIPMIVHFHGYDASAKEVLKKHAEGYKKVFSYAHAVVVVSKKMKADLIELGCPAEKLIVSVYGPNPVFFTNKPNYKNRQFIAVGRFVEKKAPYLTMCAFKRVLDEFSDAKLVMVGDGELLPICKRLAKGLGIEDNIEFKGIQTSEQIQILFENSLAFLQHSILPESGDSEGTPVAILEAQAAALPVIATNHGGIPEVVINYETGLLVDESDVDGMAQNMKTVLTEKGFAEKLGRAGRERVSQYFTMERHLESLEKIIEEAIEKKCSN